MDVNFYFYYTIILFILFIFIVVYVFRSSGKDTYEEDAKIPFEESQDK